MRVAVLIAISLAVQAVTTAPPDSPPQMSLSDIQFLEDEVETLRLTLDEAEQENNALRCK